ncbi:MAG: hypothetical protein LBQ66_13880 [Planctomycetaceae bacterium]|jgi:hypothetical protein|nr:hypothetical protein [Planctomycetaceae bacterium]
MQHSGNVLDRWANRVVFIRRLGWGFLFVCSILILFFLAYQYWYSNRPDVFDPPSYSDLDVNSGAYWSARIERDISFVNEMNVPASRRASRLRLLVSRAISIAAELDSFYDRNNAILNIALTLSKYNIDANLERVLRTMDESYESFSVRARVNISIALMQIRQKNLVGAMSAYSEYKRLVNVADLKLDNQYNEESFIGAVAVLYLAQNNVELDELFQRHVEFSRRIGTDQRMRAFRIIAVEQARAGSYLANSLNTLKLVRDPIELARAIQLIVSFVARQPKIEAKEPVHHIPRSDGPWEHIRSTLVVRNAIDSILQIVTAEYHDTDQHAIVLKRVAGSLLMCDPDVYKIFRSAISETTTINKEVRDDVLKLLDNPVSDKIRAELKMPPRPKRSKNTTTGDAYIDPAQHDWISSDDVLEIQITTIDAEILQSLDARQFVRILTVQAGELLQFNRINEMIQILRTAFNSAKLQPVPQEQIRELLEIATLQLDAGAVEEAARTIKFINTKFMSVKTPNIESNGRGINLITADLTDDNLVALVSLLIVGRFFDDAVKAATFIETQMLRDEMLVSIVRELLRIGELDAAEKIIETITSDETKNIYQHRIALAGLETANGGIIKKINGNETGKTGETNENQASGINFDLTFLPERSFDVIGIDHPSKSKSDGELARSVSQLIRICLFETAVLTALQVNDNALKSKLLAQIGREYVLITTSYSNRTNQHQTIRKRALEHAINISKLMPTTSMPETTQQVLYVLSIINATLPKARISNSSVDMIGEAANKTSDVAGSSSEISGIIELSRLRQLFMRCVGDVERAGGLVDAGERETQRDPDSLKILHGELLSQLFLTKVNLVRAETQVNVNNRKEDVDGKKTIEREIENDVSVVDKDKRRNIIPIPNDIFDRELRKLAERAEAVLGSESATFSKGRGLANVAQGLMLCGRFQEAAKAIHAAESAANELSERSHAISVLVLLLSICDLSGETESFERIKTRAVDLAVSFIPPDVNVLNINIMWRTRDIELDRITRKLVEMGMIGEALDTVANINEPLIHDRIVRAVAYIYLSKQDFTAAEQAAKKLKLQEYRFAATRDTTFLKNLIKTQKTNLDSKQ